MLVTFYKIGEVHLCLLGTEGFRAKAKNERFTAARLCCCHKLEVVVWQTTSKMFTKKYAARVARLFYLIQPIKPLICGLVVAVVISLTSYYWIIPPFG